MPTNVSYPGVYIEEDHSLALSVPAGKTAVPVFVGAFRTPKGEWADPKQCVQVNTWLEFTQHFGDSAVPTVNVKPDVEKPVTEKSKTKVQRSGEDGKVASSEGAGEPGESTPKYTVDKIDYTDYLGSLSVRHYFDNGGGTCYILPLDKKPGADENLPLVPAIEACPEISLLCYCEVTDRDGNIYSELNKLLDKNKGYFLLAGSSDGTPPGGLTNEQVAVYYPGLQTTYQRPRTDDALIAITGYQDVDADVKTLADLRKKAQPDPPNNPDPVIQGLCQQIDKALAQKAADAGPVYLRTSNTIAGIYCKTDRNRGVWKAPANVALSNVAGLVKVTTVDGKKKIEPVTVTDTEQGTLNDQGINAIRTFSDQGFVVWGARTLAGTAQSSDMRWRYIPVRRLFNSAERDIQQAMRTVMFEPNSPPTWEIVRSAIDNYLHSLWRLGALMGTKPEEAYFVQIGLGVTMTEDEINAGKLIIKVGMAAVRPAEFIILQFSQILGLGADAS